MIRVLNSHQSRQKFFFIAGLWILLWLLPWGESLTWQGNLYLIFFVDVVKLGLALGIFSVPGVLLYLLLRNQDNSLLDLCAIFPVGFTLAVAIAGVVGILGRFFGFSFILVKTIFVIIGLLELLSLYFLRPKVTLRKANILGLFRNLFKNIPLLMALILALAMTFNEHLFFIDDTIYQAYLINWQNSDHLGFKNIIHHANVIEHVRFWLALYPMSQALLSSLSGVPGILLFSNYLELYLVLLAVITAYWFARALGLTNRAAGLSVFIQIWLYTWMISDHWPVGFWFFINMAEDKVSAAFLMAPVFFVFVLKFLDLPNTGNILLVLLSGVALALTHPVILFYACVIALGLGVWSLVSKRTTRQAILQLSAVLFMAMFPYLAIRLYEHPSQSQFSFDGQTARATFQIERYTNVTNGIFYGLNPEVLKLQDVAVESNMYFIFQFFRLLPLFLSIAASVLAIKRLKEGPLYWYLLSCVLLVSFATIPYTGWILGYFVSARLISRASWFLPLGLAGALVLEEVYNHLKLSRVFGTTIRTHISKVDWKNWKSVQVFIMLIFTAILMGAMVWSRVEPYFKVLEHNYQLAQVGAYIDRNTDRPTTVIALNYTETQLLPGVSVNTSLISFREETDLNGHNYFLSLEEIHERIYASNTIRSLDIGISNSERCRFLKMFHVRYVLAGPDDAEPFAAKVNACAMAVRNVLETKDLVLLELR